MIKMSFRYNSPVTINDENLTRILDFHLPVLLFFWQDFRHLAPVNDELLKIAREKAGKLLIAKINAAQNNDGSKYFHIDDTPLILGLKDGNELPRMVAHQQQVIRAYAQFVLDEGPLPEPISCNDPGQEIRLPAKPIESTDATFENLILQSEIPVLVDFWASWCAPCQILAPTLRQLAREFDGLIRIAKIDVDENPFYAGLYGVQHIPTLLLFSQGQIIDQFSGVNSLQQLRDSLNKHLSLLH